MDRERSRSNSLRVLNDYLNQTIEALVRTQRAGVVAPLNMTGITHSPFAMTTPFGIPQTTLPSYLLAHTPYTPYNTNTGVFATTPFVADPTAIDPFIAQRVPLLGGDGRLAALDPRAAGEHRAPARGTPGPAHLGRPLLRD